MDSLRLRLESHLQQLAHPRDPDWSPFGHHQVKQYIHRQLSCWGAVEEFQFEFLHQPYSNWILKVPGAKPGRDPILIGAHFDAVPQSPGADDNASGVAVLLELARHFAQDPCDAPVWLVAFDLEERGLVGSTAYARFLKQKRQPLRLMLSLEMLGYCDPRPGSQHYPAGLERFYPNRGDYIGLIGNWLTLPDLMRLQRSMNSVGIPCQWLPVGQTGRLLPATRRSDHAPFWDEGYRAILVTDTAQFRNPHYHKLSDRVETLDLEFLTGVCRGLIAGLQHL